MQKITSIGLCLLTGLALAASATVAGPADAEASGWQLFFSDDFQRAELGKDWQIAAGDWRIEDGILRGSGTLITAQGVPPDHPAGFLRLEFVAMAASETGAVEMSGFIHARPPDTAPQPEKTGYLFQFGALDNTINRLQRNGAPAATDETGKVMVVPGRRHHVMLESDQGKLRAMVDGQLIFELDERQSILGPGFDRVGLRFEKPVQIDQLKIYVKRLPCDLDLD